MRKVILYSLLLVAGLITSQFLPQRTWLAWPIRILTMAALSFIMIHAGYEFEMDKTRPRSYLWDYVVAGTAAAFPWVFCTLYFVYAMAPQELWGHPDLWRETLLVARFASPTSAGVLFSMLAAAGLAATWMFQKARILAIFDDLDTILLMIPLQIMMVGMRWQLAGVVAIIFVLLWLAWRYLHAFSLPVSWPFVLFYAALITAVSETIYLLSKVIDSEAPIHFEVLLPAFVLGCVLARPQGADPHRDDAIEGVEVGPEDRRNQRASTIVSACFMVLVGLSMPAVFGSVAQAATTPYVVIAASSAPHSARAYSGVSSEVM
jgi:Kef-type K+ transport system membrane component KefB